MKNFDKLGFIDVSLVSFSDGPTDHPDMDYTETVNNNTGIKWTDFEISIISAPNGSKFVPAVIFNEPFGPGVISLNGQLITFAGGTGLPSGQTFKPEFTIDSPVGASGTYVIRETPTVPEPSGLVLIGLGIASVANLKWHSRRARCAQA